MAQRGRPLGGTSLANNWTRDKCPGGEDRAGWCAGDLHRLPMHGSENSRPCPDLLTHHRLACPLCARFDPVVEFGFLPVFRNDGRQLVLLLRAHSFERASAIPFGKAIVWGRRKGRGETIWVQRDEARKDWVTTDPLRRVAADLAAWLPIFLRAPELTAAIAAWLVGSDNAVSLPPVCDAKPVTHGVVADTREVIQQGRGVVDAGEEVGSLVAQFKARGKSVQPSANGKHTKKG